MTAALDGDFGGSFPFEPRYLHAGGVRLHYRHRCVAFDHMGFGRSDKPPYLGGYSLEAHVQNTLVLMNTWAWELPSFLTPFLREFRTGGLGEILALGGNLFVESIPGGMHRRDTDPLMMEAYRAPFPDYWSRVAPLAFQREIPLTERDRSAALMGSIHERLPELDQPVLLVWGMRDPVFQPVFLDQWRELFPAARVVELDAAAHYLVEDEPDAVTAALAESANSF